MNSTKNSSRITQCVVVQILGGVKEVLGQKVVTM